MTNGTLFHLTLGTARYDETNRQEFDVSPDTTIGGLVTLCDEESPPHHPGSSYLSLAEPHGPLASDASLQDLGLKDGAVLRRFSFVR